MCVSSNYLCNPQISEIKTKSKCIATRKNINIFVTKRSQTSLTNNLKAFMQVVLQLLKYYQHTYRKIIRTFNQTTTQNFIKFHKNLNTFNLNYFTILHSTLFGWISSY